MVSIFVSYVITLYLSMQIEGRTKVQQMWQQCHRIDKESPLNKTCPKNEFDIGQAAKPIKKALNMLPKGTDERGKQTFGN